MPTPKHPEPKPPLLLPNVLIFSLTMAVAVVGVPWWGFEHGFKAATWALFAFLLVANGMSITGGYHRLWAHRTYEAHPALKVLYLIFGTMALQQSVLVWASDHRRHHLNVDDYELDPYCAGRGFWFSHMGWMVRRYRSGVRDFTNVPDLRRDRLLVLQDRYYPLLTTTMNVVPPLAAGWLIGDVWGTFLLAGVLRLVLSHHFTFFINSLAHMWGSRPYTDENSARDNPVLALVTHGEGYHNFHHIFAHDYRNGVRWWQWDPTKWLIASLQWIGLTRRLKRTPTFQIQRALLATQFRHAQAKLARLADPGHTPAYAARVPSHIAELRHRIAQEYEAFVAAVSDWTRLKEQWLEEKKRAVIERWEHARFQQRLREMELRLKSQRRRLRSLQAQLA
ncbi:MAG: fatty acid desaturase [Steroidobacteraceae bacterium]